MNEAKRILVIEDDPILRDLLAEWLLAAGYLVGLAAEGGAGLAAVAELVGPPAA
jgi:CheY-like chemotaxis protein